MNTATIAALQEIDRIQAERKQLETESKQSRQEMINAGRLMDVIRLDEVRIEEMRLAWDESDEDQYKTLEKYYVKYMNRKNNTKKLIAKAMDLLDERKYNIKENIYLEFSNILKEAWDVNK